MVDQVKRPKKKKEKNISNRIDHLNSSGDIINSPTVEMYKRIRIIICMFLVIATFAIYWQVQDHQFLNYDDNQYVTDNLNVRAGLTRESIKWAFTTAHFFNWHPITWLSHMVDYEFYGLHPTGHHLTNLFLHIANALLLFMVFLRMTGTLWQSGFVAAMFALHPFNVESVAWVAERKNVLSTFFLLLTIWMYIRYVDKPSIKRYGWIVLFFVLGLMSKPMLVTLPFVLLLIDYWPLGRLRLGQGKYRNDVTEKYVNKRSEILQLVREKVPLFLLATASSVVTFIVQKSSGALHEMGTISLSSRINNALVSYLEYLEKTLWPKGLAVFYPHPGNALVLWKGILGGILLVSITTIAIKFIRKAPYFAVGWFWYLGTLVPVIQIIQTGSHAMADRYAYVPLIGIFIIIAWGVPELMAKWHYKKKILSIFIGVLIPVLMMVTWAQVGHWKNSITIFKHAIRVTDKEYPTFGPTHNNLGMALFSQGKIEEAISHYKMAIKLKLERDRGKEHNNLGIALFAQGKTEEAISQYMTAIRLDPNAEAHNNLGIALFAQGKTEEAISHYMTAIKLKPDYVDAHYNLGNTLSAELNFFEAAFHYKKAIKLKPDYVDAHYNLGNAFLSMQDPEKAIAHYGMAIKFRPNYVDAHYNLGNAYFSMQEPEKAVAHYKMAIRLNPEYVEAYYNLGNILFNARSIEEAIDYYEEAIKIRPDFALPHNNLGNALIQNGKIKEAIDHYREALRLKPNLIPAQKNLEMALMQANKMENFK